MKKAFYLFCLLIMSLQLLAQWTPNASVNTPIGVRSGDQVVTKCITHPSGYTWYAWFSLESGNYNVRVQKTDIFGNRAFGTEGLLVSNNNSDTWVTDFDLAVDQDTCAVVVFQDIRAGNNEVFAYRISPSGQQLWGSNGVRLSNSADADYSPKVCITTDGNAVVVWQQDSDEQKVLLQKVSPGGSKLWGGGIVLQSSSGQNYMFPSILATSNDEVYVLWFKRGSGMYDPKHLYAQRLDSYGALKWASDKAIFTSAGIPMIPSISLIPDTDDGFYVAWYDDRNNDWNYSTFVQHMTASGAVQFAANGVEAVVNNSNNHMYPSIALSPDGSAVYVFLVEMNANQTQRGLYGQKINSAGVRQWANSGKVFQPVSTLDLGMVSTRSLDDDVVVFYAKKSNLGGDQIRAMKINADGNYIWDGTGHVTLSSANGIKDDLVIGQHAAGQFIAAWSDQRTDNGDIYAQNINDDGSLGAQILELVLNPDTLIFDEYSDPFIAGKYFAVKNPTSQPATISQMDMDGFLEEGAAWYVDTTLTFPVTIQAGDSLWLNVKFQLWVTDAVPGFVCDSLNIFSDMGEYVEIILLDSVFLWDNLISPDKISELNVFPNPAHHSVSVNFVTMKPELLNLALLSSEGKMTMLKKNFRTVAGRNTIGLELTKLTSGSYNLILTDVKTKQHTSIKLIIQ